MLSHFSRVSHDIHDPSLKHHWYLQHRRRDEWGSVMVQKGLKMFYLRLLSILQLVIIDCCQQHYSQIRIHTFVITKYTKSHNTDKNEYLC